MKKTLHVMNSVLTVLLGVVAIALCFFIGSPDDTRFVAVILCASMLGIMVIADLIHGVFAPEEGSEKMANKSKAVLFFEKIANLYMKARYLNLYPNYEYHRAWLATPVIVFALLYGTIGVLAGYEGGRQIVTLLIVGGVLLILLTFGSFGWSLLNNKERTGKYNVGKELLPIAVLFAIVGFGALIAFVQMKVTAKNTYSYSDIEELHEKVNQMESILEGMDIKLEDITGETVTQ